MCPQRAASMSLDDNTGHNSKIWCISYTAHRTVYFTQQENVDFTEPDTWPANNPEINPADYTVCAALGEHKIVYTSNVTGRH